MNDRFDTTIGEILSTVGFIRKAKILGYARKRRNRQRSNVDMAQEFVNLIQYQRGFQANSRTVTTADEMLQDLLSMKR